MDARTVFSALVLLVILSSASSMRLAQAANSYVNKELGFSITPPEGWENIAQKFGNRVFFFGPVNPESGLSDIYIIVFSKNTPLTLSEYVNSSGHFTDKKDADFDPAIMTENTTDLKILSQNYRFIAGLNGYEVVKAYTVRTDNTSMIQKDVGFVENGNAYVITLVATSLNYDVYLPVFEQSLQTFRLGTPAMPPIMTFSETPWLIILGLEYLSIGVIAVLRFTTGRNRIQVFKKTSQKRVGPTARELLVVGGVLAFYGYFFSLMHWGVFIIVFGPGVITWAAWHFFSPTIAYHIATFRLKKSGKRVFLVDESETQEFDVNVWLMSIYLILFMITFSMFVMDWIGTFAGRPFASTSSDVLNSIVVLNLIFLPLFSPLFVATNLIFKTSGARCFDTEKHKIETFDKATFFRYLPNFIGVGAILTLVKVYFSVNDLSDLSIYFSFLLFPWAFFVTSLYLWFSLSKNREQFVRKLEESVVWTMHNSDYIKNMEYTRVPEWVKERLSEGEKVISKISIVRALTEKAMRGGVTRDFYATDKRLLNFKNKSDYDILEFDKMTVTIQEPGASVRITLRYILLFIGVAFILSSIFPFIFVLIVGGTLDYTYGEVWRFLFPGIVFLMMFLWPPFPRRVMYQIDYPGLDNKDLKNWQIPRNNEADRFVEIIRKKGGKFVG